ncbi:6-carboxytetrahydropterin synthase [Nonomuraea sp. FMUSA5-5]|uniref:6-carboxy-5,6,7,8-tetrahydropterin synthase n=1 Tax=Nonomuraea composti TaxID=2720023 RepID=A0ABX1BL42_9ACTN|nr:6-carboxytetrahydropterin synthase [Nonomuraea sp. FMUSA5-5]NJP98454.1 6-carboxytetrahydropterin synthase [Nonomuraea sp. FMUSA5-5]
MHSVTLKHNFETAHRLPHLGGKCVNLHGHSWHTEITIAASRLTDRHTVVEFGDFKAVMRNWIDVYLDHGVMLGHRDPLLPAFTTARCKVYTFGVDWDGADWPTVEAVAALLADQAGRWLALIDDMPADAHIAHVTVQETATNAADWYPPAPGREPMQGRLPRMAVKDVA